MREKSVPGQCKGPVAGTGCAPVMREDEGAKQMPGWRRLERCLGWIRKHGKKPWQGLKEEGNLV